MTTFQNFRTLTALFFLAAGLLSACNATASDPELPATPPLRTHYLILLDLSDRLLQPGQSDRDKTILLALKERFIRECKEKTILLSEDRFSIRIASQKHNALGLEEAWFEDSLSLDLSTLDETSRRSALDQFSRNFEDRLNKLYHKATTFSDQKMYQGADLWGYFRDELAMDISQDSNTRMFLLTDGYLDFENPAGRKQGNRRYTDSGFLRQYRRQNWEQDWENRDEGILSIAIPHSERITLQLLELNPKQDWQDEYPLLCRMWTKWMQENQIRLQDQPLSRERPMSSILAAL